jgi:excisionase family DNA binding protein
MFLQSITLEQLAEAMRPVIRHELAQIQAASVTTPVADEKWTVDASAKYLDISRATLFDWLRRGLLCSTKLGGRTYLLRSDVIAAGTQRQRTVKPSREKSKPLNK